MLINIHATHFLQSKENFKSTDCLLKKWQKQKSPKTHYLKEYQIITTKPSGILPPILSYKDTLFFILNKITDNNHQLYTCAMNHNSFARKQTFDNFVYFEGSHLL